MQKRIFIIHGWGGYPEEGCFPWLKKELEKKGFIVKSPAMPNPLNPEIDVWTSIIKEKVVTPDEQTYFVGHSIGAQTILRYFQSLEKGIKVGGAVFLAGWVNLTPAAYEDERDREIVKPWLETPINWNKIKTHTDKFIAIFSDNDRFVPREDSQIFKEKLGAKIIIEHNKGHFSGTDGIKELQSILDSILKIAGVS
ncbi:MAG: alpha/beta hydrolase [Patescibacteria group bacterium]